MSETHVTVKIPKDLIEEMDKLIGTHGFRSRGEIAKEALRQLLASYQTKETNLPRMEQINSDENGVKILDRQVHRVADVSIKRTGIHCNLDDTDDCEHITYALAQKDVQKLIRQKKALGWKLPDI